MPASTVRSSGWTGLSCRRLLRSACSLASAGNVCWAKPNHAFFRCQQSFAKFFSAALAATARDGRIVARRSSQHAHHMHTRMRSRSPACKQQRGLQRFDAKQKQFDADHCAACPACRDDRRRRGERHREAAPDFAPHKCVCAKTARTFSQPSLFARVRAGIEAHAKEAFRRRRRRVEDARRASATGMKKPATFPSRVPGDRWKCDQCSSLSSSSA